MNDTDRIRFHIACETEGEVSPAQRDSMSAQHIADVERLCLVDLINVMRDVRMASRSMNEMERERYAKRFAQLALEADTATAFLRRHRASVEVPEWLREHAGL